MIGSKTKELVKFSIHFGQPKLRLLPNWGEPDVPVCNQQLFVPAKKQSATSFYLP